MEEEKREELMKKAEEILEADNKEIPAESPLDKAERLNKETKEMMEKIEKDKSEYENQRANDQMKGRSILTAAPKTEEEKDKQVAEDMAKGLLG
jgi:hypothetical protein